MHHKNPQEERLIMGGGVICILWFSKMTWDFFQPFIQNHHFIPSKIVEGSSYCCLFIWLGRGKICYCLLDFFVLYLLYIPTNMSDVFKVCEKWLVLFLNIGWIMRAFIIPSGNSLIASLSQRKVDGYSK